MIAASVPAQGPADAKLLVIDRYQRISHLARASFVELLRPKDLLIANDAATLPASLQGTHVRTGVPVEVRLAGRRSLNVDDVTHFDAIVFGAGDFRTPTEQRPSPPTLLPGDRIRLGPLRAVIERLLDHPRLVSLKFEGTPGDIWSGLARHGRPIQYAHVATPLALWDVWTSHAALPVAFEPPSAGFPLNWRVRADIRARGAKFATLTHAAGISSTGDPELDRKLPFDEPYYIPRSTAEELRIAKASGGRVIAIGTTVVRALEHAASLGAVVDGGFGIASQRIGPQSALRAVDAILSGAHAPGTSHYELLRAFVDNDTLERASNALEAHGYKAHEFGDSVLLERSAVKDRGGSNTSIRSGVAESAALPRVAGLSA
jgi:S-adenosylmethionine:tRNA ribosyltransferase-isomerase